MESVKLSKDLYVPIDNIKYYVAYNSNFVKRNVREQKKNGNTYDVCCGKKIMTVIYLKTGDVILSPININTINNRIINGGANNYWV